MLITKYLYEISTCTMTLMLMLMLMYRNRRLINHESMCKRQRFVSNERLSLLMFVVYLDTLIHTCLFKI